MNFLDEVFKKKKETPKEPEIPKRRKRRLENDHKEIGKRQNNRGEKQNPQKQPSSEENVSRTSSVTNLADIKGSKTASGGSNLTKSKRSGSKDRLDKPQSENKKKVSKNDPTLTTPIDNIKIDQEINQNIKMDQKSISDSLENELKLLKEENLVLRTCLKDVSHSPLSDNEKQQLLTLNDGLNLLKTEDKSPKIDQNEIFSLKETQKKMQETLFCTNEELQATLQELNDLQKQLTDLQQDNDQLIDEKNLMFDSLCRQTERLNETKNELENFKTVFNQKLNQKHEKEIKNDDFIDDLTSKLEKVTEKFELNQKELDDNKVYQNELKNQLKLLESELKSKEIDNLNLKLQHNVILEEIERKSNEIAQLKHLLTTYSTKIDDLQQQNQTEIEKKSIENSIENEKLKNQIGNLQCQLEKLQNNSKLTQNELQIELSSVKIEKNDLSEEVRSIKASMKSLRNDLEKEIDQKNRISINLNETKKLLDDLEVKNEKLSGELDDLKMIRKNENEEWERFQNDLLTSVRVANDFKTEAQQDLQKIMSENKAFREKVCQLEVTVEKLSGDQNLSNSTTSGNFINNVYEREEIVDSTYPQPEEIIHLKQDNFPSINDDQKPKDLHKYKEPIESKSKITKQFIKKPKIFRASKGYHFYDKDSVQEEDKSQQKDVVVKEIPTKSFPVKEVLESQENQKKVDKKIFSVPKIGRKIDQNEKNLAILNDLYQEIDPTIPEEDLTQEQRVIIQLKRSYELNSNQKNKKKINSKSNLVISKPLLNSVFQNRKLKEFIDDPTMKSVENMLFEAPNVFYPTNFDDVYRNNIEFRYYNDPKSTFTTFKTDSLSKSKSLNDLSVKDDVQLKRQFSESILSRSDDSFSSFNDEKDLDEIYKEIKIQDDEEKIVEDKIFEEKRKEIAKTNEDLLQNKVLVKKGVKKSLKISSPIQESILNDEKLLKISQDDSIKSLSIKKPSMFVKIKSKLPKKNEFDRFYVYDHEKMSVIDGALKHEEKLFVSRLDKNDSIPPTETFNTYLKNKIEHEKTVETRNIEIQTDDLNREVPVLPEFLTYLKMNTHEEVEDEIDRNDEFEDQVRIKSLIEKGKMNSLKRKEELEIMYQLMRPSDKSGFDDDEIECNVKIEEIDDEDVKIKEIEDDGVKIEEIDEDKVKIVDELKKNSKNGEGPMVMGPSMFDDFSFNFYQEESKENQIFQKQSQQTNVNRNSSSILTKRRSRNLRKPTGIDLDFDDLELINFKNDQEDFPDAKLSRDSSFKSTVSQDSNEEEIIRNISSKLDVDEVEVVKTLRRKYKVRERPKSEINDEDLRLIEEAKMKCLSPEYQNEEIWGEKSSILKGNDKEIEIKWEVDQLLRDFDGKSKEVDENFVDSLHNVDQLNQKVDQELHKMDKNESLNVQFSETSIFAENLVDFLENIDVPMRKKKMHKPKDEFSGKVEHFERESKEIEENFDQLPRKVDHSQQEVEKSFQNVDQTSIVDQQPQKMIKNESLSVLYQNEEIVDEKFQEKIPDKLNFGENLDDFLENIDVPMRKKKMSKPKNEFSGKIEHFERKSKEIEENFDQLPRKIDHSPQEVEKSLRNVVQTLQNVNQTLQNVDQSWVVNQQPWEINEKESLSLKYQNKEILEEKTLSLAENFDQLPLKVDQTQQESEKSLQNDVQILQDVDTTQPNSTQPNPSKPNPTQSQKQVAKSLQNVDQNQKIKEKGNLSSKYQNEEIPNEMLQEENSNLDEKSSKSLILKEKFDHLDSTHQEDEQSTQNVVQILQFVDQSQQEVVESLQNVNQNQKIKEKGNLSFDYQNKEILGEKLQEKNPKTSKLVEKSTKSSILEENLEDFLENVVPTRKKTTNKLKEEFIGKIESFERKSKEIEDNFDQLPSKVDQAHQEGEQSLQNVVQIVQDVDPTKPNPTQSQQHVAKSLQNVDQNHKIKEKGNLSLEYQNKKILDKDLREKNPENSNLDEKTSKSFILTENFDQLPLKVDQTQQEGHQSTRNVDQPHKINKNKNISPEHQQEEILDEKLQEKIPKISKLEEKSSKFSILEENLEDFLENVVVPTRKKTTNKLKEEFIGKIESFERKSKEIDDNFDQLPSKVDQTHQKGEQSLQNVVQIIQDVDTTQPNPTQPNPSKPNPTQSQQQVAKSLQNVDQNQKINEKENLSPEYQNKESLDEKLQEKNPKTFKLEEKSSKSSILEENSEDFLENVVPTRKKTTNKLKEEFIGKIESFERKSKEIDDNFDQLLSKVDQTHQEGEQTPQNVVQLNQNKDFVDEKLQEKIPENLNLKDEGILSENLEDFLENVIKPMRRKKMNEPEEEVIHEFNQSQQELNDIDQSQHSLQKIDQSPHEIKQPSQKTPDNEHFLTKKTDDKKENVSESYQKLNFEFYQPKPYQKRSYENLNSIWKNQKTGEVLEKKKPAKPISPNRFSFQQISLDTSNFYEPIYENFSIFQQKRPNSTNFESNFTSSKNPVPQPRKDFVKNENDYEEKNDFEVFDELSLEKTTFDYVKNDLETRKMSVNNEENEGKFDVDVIDDDNDVNVVEIDGNTKQDGGDFDHLDNLLENFEKLKEMRKKVVEIDGKGEEKINEKIEENVEEKMENLTENIDVTIRKSEEKINKEDNSKKNIIKEIRVSKNPAKNITKDRVSLLRQKFEGKSEESDGCQEKQQKEKLTTFKLVDRKPI